MRKLKGKEAWLNHSLPGGTGEGLIKTACAAALLVHLVDERRGRAGPDLAACLRSYSSVEFRCASENCEYWADLRGRFSAPALDPPALQSSPSQGPRTPGLRRTQAGLSKSCRGAFRSPRPSPKSGQADGASEDSLHLDVQKLKEKKDMLDKEISQLISEGYSVDELEDHISQLHEYNDIKDVGQMLLGRLEPSLRPVLPGHRTWSRRSVLFHSFTVIRGVTTKELYPEFDLDMND
ncbi:DNA repair protein SWI5 homolog isoform X4 [Pseudorca crassidens]|uniref:DNA repair protein SWI5 homolog isoform X4 n=1 Tax=Pseudorca crassidens TaxID=82174 RepID=UPI00352F050C